MERWVKYSSAAVIPQSEFLSDPLLQHSKTPSFRFLFLLQIQSALSEQLFDCRLLRDQSLLMGERDNRLEHFPVGFDAVRIWIVAEHILCHRQIFFAEEERRWNAVDEFGVEVRLGLYERGVEIERGPRVFLINVTANRVGVVDRQKSPLLKETFSFGKAVGKEQFDLAPLAVGAGNAM